MPQLPSTHWTISTQIQGKRFGFVTLPVSDWYLGSGIAQSIEAGHTPSSIDALVDYYYGLGALINLYMHVLSTSPNSTEYIRHSAAKPNIWPVNAPSLYEWWTKRSPAQVVPSYTIANNRLIAIATITGARDPNVAVELVIPNWAMASAELQVKLNGASADPSSYRVYRQGIKVRVGTTVSKVEVTYPFLVVAQRDASVSGSPASSSGRLTAKFLADYVFTGSFFRRAMQSVTAIISRRWLALVGGLTGGMLVVVLYVRRRRWPKVKRHWWR